MGRGATLNVSLTPEQLRLIRRQVACGHYASTSEVVRDGLRMLFGQERGLRPTSTAGDQRRLAAGYKATARRDRKLAREWGQLPEAWPEK